ncbi:MAG TPA: VOC family protein [Gemmatimonadaceae bacterium]
MPEINPRGRFVWHELMTTDPEAAIRFYPTVTGWGVQPFEQDPSYRMWTVNGAPIGGVLPIADEAKAMGARPYWLPYIGTEDIEESTSHAVRLGATVFVPPTPIPVGVFSVLRDPQGATFALFASAGPALGHEGAPNVGEFSWHELRTSDGEAAWAFYRELCGWNETSTMDMGPMGKYRMFGRNGVELGGMYNKPDRVAGPPAWLSYVRIPSTDHSVGRVVALGGRVLNGPMEVPGGNYIAELCDDLGVGFAVHEERENGAAARPSAKPKAKAKAKAKAKPKAKAKAKPKAKPKAKAKAKPKVKAKAKAKSRPKAKAKPKAKSKPSKKKSRPARKHR